MFPLKNLARKGLIIFCIKPSNGHSVRCSLTWFIIPLFFVCAVSFQAGWHGACQRRGRGDLRQLWGAAFRAAWVQCGVGKCWVNGGDHIGIGGRVVCRAALIGGLGRSEIWKDGCDWMARGSEIWKVGFDWMAGRVWNMKGWLWLDGWEGLKYERMVVIAGLGRYEIWKDGCDWMAGRVWNMKRWLWLDGCDWMAERVGNLKGQLWLQGWEGMKYEWLDSWEG